MPSTARPSHLGGRASCTWRNTDREPLAKCPGDKRNSQGGAVFASNRRRPQRGRRPQTQKLTSACARRQCPPLSRRTHHRPLSPPTCLVCTAGGTDGFIAKLPPAGVLTGIKILPYKRGQRTREGNFSQLRDKFSRSDSLKEKGWMGGGAIAG